MPVSAKPMTEPARKATLNASDHPDRWAPIVVLTFEYTATYTTFCHDRRICQEMKSEMEIGEGAEEVG